MSGGPATPDAAAKPRIVRWRVRHGRTLLGLHADRLAAHAAAGASAVGGVVERLPWQLEVEVAPPLGLMPCPRCPRGWMFAVASDTGEVDTADGSRGADAQHLLGCSVCCFSAEALRAQDEAWERELEASFADESVWEYERAAEVADVLETLDALAMAWWSDDSEPPL